MNKMMGGGDGLHAKIAMQSVGNMQSGRFSQKVSCCIFQNGIRYIFWCPLPEGLYPRFFYD